jgi:hypothetical protein
MPCDAPRIVPSSFCRPPPSLTHTPQRQQPNPKQALRQLPTIIADNGGYDSSELITQLRAAHARWVCVLPWELGQAPRVPCLTVTPPTTHGMII